MYIKVINDYTYVNGKLSNILIIIRICKIYDRIVLHYSTQSKTNLEGGGAWKRDILALPLCFS